jgi:hypothetical protein
VDIADVGAWFAVIGLDLAMRAYPAGDPIRDRPQLALLERLRTRLHPGLRWRTEVPVPIEGDLRAWDADARGTNPGRWRLRIDAETHIGDGQALARRLSLKARDDPDGHVVLLVSATRMNRHALALIREGLRDLLPLDSRELLRRLASGEDPRQGGVIVL